MGSIFFIAIFIVIALYFVIMLIIPIQIIKALKTRASRTEIISGTLYLLLITVFILALSGHSHPYYEAIDPVDGNCYEVFATKHRLSLLFYLVAFNVSLILVWLKKNTLPPLMLCLAMIFILLGVILNGIILVQVSEHDTKNLYTDHAGQQALLLLAPLMGIILGLHFLYKISLLENQDRIEKHYKNKFLQYLNIFLTKKSHQPLWILLFSFPMMILCTLILLVFGQDVNSMTKVFTDTATWRFSQQIHPPILAHNGHYLCTVAAAGNPEIVKPLRLGKRHGQKIIVNRQLLVANAFEEMIQNFWPKLHHVIRKNYDLYGYNLSKKINTAYLSDLTYVLMKPLEWIFVIMLYFFCYQPEQKINKQYALTN